MSTLHPPHPPHPPHAHPAGRAPHRPLIRLDPGWLFLIAGLAIVACTVLIPADADLEAARWERNKALAIERHRLARLDRYGQFLAAVLKGDEDVALSLTATQLNLSPADRIPLMVAPEPLAVSASPFPSLEPPPLELPPPPGAEHPPSMLARLATSDRHRLWLISGGVLCVLIGVLPGIPLRRR